MDDDSFCPSTAHFIHFSAKCVISKLIKSISSSFYTSEVYCCLQPFDVNKHAAKNDMFCRQIQSH